MRNLESQVAYRDAAADTKTFAHPLHRPWLDGLARDVAVLDYGCGYGRSLAELAEQGFVDLAGVDVSPRMVERARALVPVVRLGVLDAPPRTSYADAILDLVLLFAVLTCVPGGETQHRLMEELRRILRPGALLYLSDLPLQDDERNRDRYRRDAARFGTYGVFATDDGAVCRHHSPAWLAGLLAGFETVATRTVPVTTMNGHASTVVQVLARKPD